MGGSFYWLRICFSSYDNNFHCRYSVSDIKWSVVDETYFFSWKECLTYVMVQKDRYAKAAYDANENLTRKQCEREFFERLGTEYGFYIIWPSDQAAEVKE